MIVIKEWKRDNLDLNNESFPANSIYKKAKSKKDQLELVSPNEPFNVIDKVKKMRKAAECHRQVRRYIQGIIKPEMKLYDICNSIEKKTRDLLGDDLKGGMGFPTGVSINNIAAHDSANPNDERILKKNDVCKIDFGTHVDGYIIDSAFTVAFNPIYQPLLEATREGTWAGIKMSGVDAVIDDISESIQEVINSYTIDLNNKTYPIKVISNLGGHNIEQYVIHGGKLILGAPDKNYQRMKADECYAIETFATTGKTGEIKSDYDLPCNHFMLNDNINFRNLKFNITKQLLPHIKKTRSTLPFCSRWLYDKFGRQYSIGLNELIKNDIVIPYEPLVDKKDTYTSQFEHTIYIHEFGKEVMSEGDDY